MHTLYGSLAVSGGVSLVRDYEVIIVGAGPAGATMAYELASRQIKVLVLEKAVFPRYKCCAGGLTVRSAALLGTNIDSFVENTISGAVVTFAGDGRYQGSSDKVMMYTVDRERFDFALMKRAQEAGAHILQGLEAKAIDFGDRDVRTSTTDGDFYSRFIVGADGAGSLVARALGINTSKNHLAGVQAEVRVTDQELAKRKSEIAIELGRVSNGYAWVFPKSQHLSIGVACVAGKAKALRRYCREFLESLSLGRYTIARWGSGIIPVCTGSAVCTRGRAVLLGDAAGLADPLTGEGIHGAILSAQLAAPAIEKSLQLGEVRLDDYRKSVEERIVPEARTAHVFSRVLGLFPREVFRLLEEDERIWEAGCKMMRGEINYSAIESMINALGPSTTS